MRKRSPERPRAIELTALCAWRRRSAATGPMLAGAAVSVAMLVVGLGGAAVAAAAIIECGEATIAAGESGPITVRLRSEGSEVAGVQNDINLPWGLSVLDNGRAPRCRVNPAIDKDLSAFAFVPWGEGDRAAAVRALILGLNLASIADGAVLYTCDVAVDRSLPPGIYRLRLSAAYGSTSRGEELATQGVDCRIQVSTATAGASEGGTADVPSAGAPSEGSPSPAHPIRTVHPSAPPTVAPAPAMTPPRSEPTATPTRTPQMSGTVSTSDRGGMPAGVDGRAGGCQVSVVPGAAAADPRTGILFVAALAWVARRKRR